MDDKKKAAPKWIFNNSKGKPDVIMTLLVMAFFVVSFRVIAGAIGGFKLLGKEFVFSEIDSGLVAVYLGSLLTSYVAKRNFGNTGNPPQIKK